MIRLNVVVPYRRKLVSIALPDNTLPVEQLIPALLDKFYLPDGEYIIKVEGAELPLEKGVTLVEARIKSGTTLVLERVLSAEEQEVSLDKSEQGAVLSDGADKKTAVSTGMTRYFGVVIFLSVVAVLFCIGIVLLIRHWEIYW